MRATVMTGMPLHLHYNGMVDQSAMGSQPMQNAGHSGGLKGQSISGTMTSLTDESPKANNYLDAQRVKPAAAGVSLKFDANGATAITLPPYSVNTLTLNPKN